MNNEPAFPHVVPVMGINVFGSLDQIGEQHHSGLSKREYFAAAALTGALAGRADSLTPTEWAKLAFVLADAMLDESSK